MIIIVIFFIALSTLQFSIKNLKLYNENLGHILLYIETYLAGKN